MKVLAIDPGYGRCGMAVMEKVNGKEILIYSDCIETSPKDEFGDRLAAVADACTRLINTHHPDTMVMEKLYVSKNQKTAMCVAEVRGALLHAAALANVPVFEYTPGQIKQAAAGFGGADKTQVAKMLHLLVRIDKTIHYDDEYDAIAIAITHFAHTKISNPS
jgi:crossover junction endodeoxyribonuclease RuvC